MQFMNSEKSIGLGMGVRGLDDKQLPNDPLVDGKKNRGRARHITK